MPSVPFTSIYPDGPAGSAAAGADGGGTSSGNDAYPGMPAGATPVHRDVTITTATTTALWTPQTGNRFVLASALVSTDTAQRVALVDETDVIGSRPVDAYFGANGGASPNLVPVPYAARAIGNTLRVVTSSAGNCKVRVSGWEVSG